MKNVLVLLIFIIPFGVDAQNYTYSPNTIYMTPPTNGCNGEWAVLDTMYSSGFCQFPVYSVNPFSCATISHRNGDTLFFNLCTIPCGVTITGDSGNVCLACNVDFATNVLKNVTANSIIDVFPNPNNGNFKLTFKEPGNYQVELINNMGIRVFSKNVATKNYPINARLNNGLYVLKITNLNSKKVFYQKIVVQE